ncbi:proline-rich protein 19 [Tenrec ecaudatus]|uniref:proline-rich protein 19 n=1 Tax=Tenrec ecaudatus TaxID=94439 RepID=UPI003F5AB5BF
MDLRGPASQPFQQLEKPGRVRRRKTRRERNEALVNSRRPSARQDLPAASRKPLGALRNPMGPAASKLVLITQGRLSREHWGLFNHEVKSLDVARLLSNRALEPDTPPLPTRPSPSLDSTQELAPQSGDKENQLPRGLDPGSASPPELPTVGQLLRELRCQLILPQAFSRRNLVQEARDVIVSTLQTCHGCVPDLALVLRGCQSPPLSGTKLRDPETNQMTPFWINSPEQAPGGRWQSRQQRTEGPAFTMAPTFSTSPVHRANLALSRGPCSPPLSSLPSPSRLAWGPPTAFDLLKSIWLVATPPPPRPWRISPPHPLAQPLSPLLPRNLALDWSPTPPAPLPSLSWVVAQNSPESWSFPPMRLY